MSTRPPRPRPGTPLLASPILAAALARSAAEIDAAAERALALADRDRIATRYQNTAESLGFDRFRFIDFEN